MIDTIEEKNASKMYFVSQKTLFAIYLKVTQWLKSEKGHTCGVRIVFNVPPRFIDCNILSSWHYFSFVCESFISKQRIICLSKWRKQWWRDRCKQWCERSKQAMVKGSKQWWINRSKHRWREAKQRWFNRNAVRHIRIKATNTLEKKKRGKWT